MDGRIDRFSRKFPDVLDCQGGFVVRGSSKSLEGATNVLRGSFRNRGSSTFSSLVPASISVRMVRLIVLSWVFLSVAVADFCMAEDVMLRGRFAPSTGPVRVNVGDDAEGRYNRRLLNPEAFGHEGMKVSLWKFACVPEETEAAQLEVGAAFLPSSYRVDNGQRGFSLRPTKQGNFAGQSGSN